MHDLGGVGDAVFIQGPDLAGAGKDSLLQVCDMSAGHVGQGLHVPQFAVNGHQDLRFEDAQGLFDFAMGGMSGGVHVGRARIEDLGPEIDQLVDAAGNGGFVARDDAGRDDDGIAPVHLEVMPAPRNQREHRVHLALGAGADDHDFIAGVAVERLGIDQVFFVDADHPDIAGNVHHLVHAAADDGHLAARPDADLVEGLDPSDMTGEGGYQDHSAGVGDNGLNVCQDVVFAQVLGFDFGIGALAQHQPGPFAEAGETFGHQTEIAGMHDESLGRVDGKGKAAGGGVVHLDRFNGKITQLDRPACFQRMKFEAAVDLIFLELAFEELQGEGVAVDRQFHLFEQMRQGPDMVFMAVRQEDPLEPVSVVDNVGKFRDDLVDPGYVVTRKHQSGIDQDCTLAGFKHRGIQSEFPDAA